MAEGVNNNLTNIVFKIDVFCLFPLYLYHSYHKRPYSRYFILLAQTLLFIYSKLVTGAKLFFEFISGFIAEKIIMKKPNLL